MLKPYYNNIIKRAVKTPKLYFLDTGLAAYLKKWNSPDEIVKMVNLQRINYINMKGKTKFNVSEIILDKLILRL